MNFSIHLIEWYTNHFVTFTVRMFSFNLSVMGVNIITFFSVRKLTPTIRQLASYFHFVILCDTILFHLLLCRGSLTLFSQKAVFQNDAMWTVMACTKDTPIVTKCYLLGLPGMVIRCRVDVKVYLTMVGNIIHPPHKSLAAMKGCILTEKKVTVQCFKTHHECRVDD